MRKTLPVILGIAGGAIAALWQKYRTTEPELQERTRRRLSRGIGEGGVRP